MVSTKHSFNKKIFLLGFSVSLFVIIIISRLFYLQVQLTENLFKRSQNNFLRREPITSLRGNIFDTHGKLLATNRPVATIYWQGTGKGQLEKEQKETLETLSALLEKKLLNQSLLEKAEKLRHKIPLAEDISFEELSRVSEFFTDNPNIIIDSQSIRFYPHNSIASHLLGYLGYLDVDLAGKMGLEKMYEETLKGKNGKTLKIINSIGKHLKEENVENANAGNDIYTTLDLSLQKIAEQIFPKDHSGSFLLMDPKDGSIKVFLSYPNFDPNLFLKRLDRASWEDLQKENKPFLNRIFHACYPPGSTFKLISIAAALEHGEIQEDTITVCRGFTTLGRKFQCNKRDGHGCLRPIESIAHSCNMLFYQMSKRVDIDTIAHYAKKFGLGRTVSPLFQDQPGLVPTRAWKEATKGEKWWLGETLSVSIGQSFLLATPLQIARMIGAIETGYLVMPRIVEDAPPIYEPLSIRYETRQFLKQAMRAVVNEGTARILHRMDGFTIYAKTSTAQTSTLSKRTLGEKYKEHGWCAANFCYKNEPPLTMVILTENTGTAKLALITAKAFLKEYKKLSELREKTAKKNEPLT